MYTMNAERKRKTQLPNQFYFKRRKQTIVYILIFLKKTPSSSLILLLKIIEVFWGQLKPLTLFYNIILQLCLFPMEIIKSLEVNKALAYLLKLSLNPNKHINWTICNYLIIFWFYILCVVIFVFLLICWELSDSWLSLGAMLALRD